MRAPERVTLQQAMGGEPASILRHLNEWIRDTVACLARGLTLADNHQGDIVRVKSIISTDLPLTVRTTLRTRPVEVRVLSVEATPSDGVVVSGGEVEWSYTNGEVVVTDISLLAATRSDVVLWLGGG